MAGGRLGMLAAAIAAALTAPAALGPPALAAVQEADEIKVDHAFMIGRWTDDGNCDHAVDLMAGGRFVTADGGEGEWEMRDDVLVLTGPGGSLAMRVVPVSRDSVTVVNQDGRIGRSTRCGGGAGEGL